MLSSFACGYPIFLTPFVEETIVSIILFLLFFFSWVGGTGVELRAWCLVGGHCTTWAITPALFALVILDLGSHFLLRPALTTVLVFYASCCSCDDRHAPPCPAFSIEMGSCELCCSPHPTPQKNCPRTVTLQSSASQVGRIIGLNHQAQLHHASSMGFELRASPVLDGCSTTRAIPLAPSCCFLRQRTGSDKILVGGEKNADVFNLFATTWMVYINFF
jgi:hypothetical protein